MKSMEIIMRIHVVSFEAWILILKKIVERKAFHSKLTYNIVYPNKKNMTIVLNHERIELIMRIYVYLI